MQRSCQANFARRKFL